MALLNGVLVHGPSSWGCAVRPKDGELKVASDYKGLRGSSGRSPLLRGPARLAEAFAVIPAARKRLPEARLPFQRGGVLRAMLVTAIARRGVKGSRSPAPTTVPSTSQSAATSTASDGSASTSAAAPTCSARCSRAPPSAAQSPR